MVKKIFGWSLFGALTAFSLWSLTLAILAFAERSSARACGVEVGRICENEVWSASTGFLFLLVPAAGFLLLLTGLGVSNRQNWQPSVLTPWVAGALVGGLGAQLLAVTTTPPKVGVDAVWTVPSDRPATLKGEAVWTTPESLVRIRTDGATAYGLQEGQAFWRYALPSPRVVCSARADGGVGLIVHGKEDGDCDKAVALDLKTGRALWSRRLKVPSLAISAGRGPGVVGGGIALLPHSKGEVEAVDARTGGHRWTWRAPRSCDYTGRDAATATGPDRFVLTYKCDDDIKMTMLDTRGRARRTTALGTAADYSFGEAEILSARPLVVRVREAGTRGPNELLTFDPAGRRLGAIPLDGPDGKIPSNLSGLGSMTVVNGDRVHTVTDPPGKRAGRQVITYDLTGRRLWQRTFKHGVETLALGEGGLTAVSYPSALHEDVNAQLITLNPADGRPARTLTVPYASPSGVPLLLMTSGRRILVLEDTKKGHPAIRAF